MEIDDITFHNKLDIQLRFTDADPFGHVNNSIFFQYYDIAKIKYVHELWPDLDTRKYAIVVVHVEADFMAQVRIDENVSVLTAVTNVGNKSFTLYQKLVNTDTNEVKCIGKTIMVAFDLKKQESMELLPEWVDAMCKYEGRDLRKNHCPSSKG